MRRNALYGSGAELDPRLSRGGSLERSGAILSQQLLDDTRPNDGSSLLKKTFGRKDKEEEFKSGRREFEGEEERVAVVCKRGCYESHSGMNSEVDVVDLWEGRE